MFHMDCFVCIICSRTLNTGDEFYFVDDNQLVCRSDYDNFKSEFFDWLESDNKAF